jgi:ferredoxin
MGLNKMEILVAIKKVWIEEGCISCGNSEDNCPEVFKLKDGMATVLESDDYSGLEEKIIDAAEACPVEVIKYEEN